METTKMKIRLGLGVADMRDIANWCGGELYNFTGAEDCSFEYVCTDSREADEKTMFVATRGERVDGHDYIIKAIEQGCRCILCEYVPTGISGKAVAYVIVENSIDAFADCAKGYRAEKYLPAVAITGSIGKTTTKELTASVLRKGMKLYSTQGNFNSVIGMPMSLMESGRECEAAVFEMGMSGFGEIRRMTRAATPYIAMVTNIGSSHLEYLGTRENIARAKLEISEGILDGGYLLLNGDEPLLEDHFSDRYETLYVGSSECQFRFDNVRIDENGTVFDLCYRGNRIFDLRISLIGKHFAYNASFAAAAGLLMGISEQDIRAGLAEYVPGNMRMNVYEKNGSIVIADCYNAAPESMRGAIDTLASLKIAGKRIAVLGDMKELGSSSDEMHRGVGRYLALKGIDTLFAVGESGALIAEAADAAGVKCVLFERDGTAYDAMAERIKALINEGDAVLFKASRSMALEKLIEKIF
jgi:UDP-N-acetylmuramoyl-tripeptide--D-alanyl-D-alanine ligase